MPNESLIHADIFFFISTITLVILSIGFGVALFYVIRILRDAREIADKIKTESGEIVADSRRLRAALRDEGVKWRHVISLVRGFFAGDSGKAHARKSRAKEGEGK
jgi:hypothetical protein